MELKLIRHLWGVTGTWEETFPRFKEAGYVGIEAPIPEPDKRSHFRAILDQYGFSYVPMIFTRGDTVEQNLDSFRRQVDDAMPWQPLVINCHSGKDAWSDTDNVRFYEQIVRIEKQTGAAVAHETHRKRTFFNPWSTSRILKQVPDLRLCCDFSHWVCVCERLLDGAEDIVAQCAQHCLHIHARVGYAEGPQVPDPRAPEYANDLDAHERWWSAMWTAQESRGMKISTLTPEFGPPPYLHTLLYTNVPVSDLWSICDWQAQRQADRFKNHKVTHG